MQAVDGSASVPSGREAGNRTDNVIILTGGLTGSSALAGLLTEAGYWCGEDTFKKSDYNTYENAELIALNRRQSSESRRCGVSKTTRISGP